jgi:hypothetical protein
LTGANENKAAWLSEELNNIASSDDLHISPLREDGKTYGTPTWIWFAVVDDNLYVRACNGRQSRWYQAALAQKAGRIIAGHDKGRRLRAGRWDYQRPHRRSLSVETPARIFITAPPDAGSV